MVIINKNTQRIKIQKHTPGEQMEFGLELENNLTHAKFSFDIKNDGMNGFFYEFDIPYEIKNLDEGEYTYIIRINDNPTEIGILIVGDYKQNNTSYHNDKKIIQYNG